jgi:hypothetical protein
MRVVLFCLCISTVAVPALAANAYRAINWLFVVPITADTFEVIEDRGEGAPGIWCAAADYAQAAGLDGVRKRLYVIEPRGPSRTQANAIGVSFTTNPDEKLAQSPSAYSVSVTRRGDNYAIGHAINFCSNPIEDVFDGF